MREMKDSGIEWIKQIPTGWTTTRGKNILQLMKRPPKADDEVITCFRDGEVTLRKNRREEGFTFSDKEIGYQGIKKGDLVIHGMDGFAGAIGISDSDGKGSPVLVVCTTKENSRYLVYYLRTLAMQDVFLALATGIRERSCDLRWNKIADLWFPIPELNEQRRIANYLDRKCGQIDAIIAQQQEVIEKLKAYKLSVITEAVTKGLNPDVPMKDSGIEWIGLVPKHWIVSTLRNGLFDIQTGPFGSQLHAADYIENGISVVNPANIVNGVIIPDSRCSISDEKAQELEQHILIPGDVVFARRGEMGRCACVPTDTNRYFCGTGCIRLKCSAMVTPQFATDYLQIPYVKQYLELYSVGTTMSNLNSHIIAGIPMLFPPVTEQEAIHAFISDKSKAINGQIKKKVLLIDKLTEYKKSLIYEVVTGKKEIA